MHMTSKKISSYQGTRLKTHIIEDYIDCNTWRSDGTFATLFFIMDERKFWLDLTRQEADTLQKSLLNFLIDTKKEHSKAVKGKQNGR